MATNISRFLSQKFRFYTFVCIAFLLFVHGYNLNKTYLQPFTTVDEPLTFTTFIEYFIANGILRFRIPLLFMISGYIYAMKDKTSYGLQLQKRGVTLLLPYLFWSAVGLLITYIWQKYPVTAQAVYDSKLDQMGDNRPYDAIGWGGILFRWICAPIAFQLWFIAALFFYNAIYPVIRWMLAHYSIPWFALTLLLWVFEINFFVIDTRGLFFFSAGIWLQKTNVNIERKPAWLSMYISWLLFIGFSVIKTFMAFELEPGAWYTHWLLTILHQVSVLAGIVAVWFGADRVVKFFLRRPSFIWLSSFSFFVFGLHAPLVVYLTRLFYLYFSEVPNYRLLTYFIVPGIVLAFCIGIGALVRAVFPRLYGWITGGRGLRSNV